MEVSNMDCKKSGNLILKLRKEKKLTQKQLGEAMNISDKTISKWERGLGCPDVSLLGELSNVLGVNIEQILIGSIEPNDSNGGNMKKVKFYVCPTCGNVLTATGEADIACCGRKLTALEPKKAEGEHKLSVEVIDNEFFVSFQHEMTKSHFISFVAYVTCDRIHFVKLYPEQGSELRFPRMGHGRWYYHCSQHGLFVG
jgi:DNA-binding XRE family transcriptional regulator/desulfoferrodoxin (superoxide reductase-like protein)